MNYTDIRHDLHSHPGLSGHEHYAHDLIVRQLDRGILYCKFCDFYLSLQRTFCTTTDVISDDISRNRN